MVNCPNCGSKNHVNITPHRRYRRFECQDCRFSTVYEPIGSRDKLLIKGLKLEHKDLIE